MPTTPGDLSLAVGDGARRMTYAELAQAREISLASASRLARRHHWPRQAGNDGVVRFIVPLDQVQTDPRPASAKDRVSLPFNGPGQAYASSPRTDPGPEADRPKPPDHLAQAIDSLRDQLARAEVTIAFQRREIEMLFRLLAERRPWWRRWFR
jgi:hypothetical protein